MKQNKYSMTFWTLAMTALILGGCAGKSGQPSNEAILSRPVSLELVSIDLNELSEGSEIRASGLQLMENQPGLIQLRDGSASNDSVLVVAVHGYLSSGYEWVTGVKSLGSHYGSLFFFRYDWDRCPRDIAAELSNLIKEVSEKRAYARIVVFGHSYGGVVVTQLAGMLEGQNAEIHVIAAPLAGFRGITDQCGPLEYGSWAKTVRVIQHKTVKDQDGAFRELDVDPQQIDLPFYEVRTLPPTMDGHRLGHNWSVTWVLDQHVGKAHRL